MISLHQFHPVTTVSILLSFDFNSPPPFSLSVSKATFSLLKCDQEGAGWPLLTPAWEIVWIYTSWTGLITQVGTLLDDKWCHWPLFIVNVSKAQTILNTRWFLISSVRSSYSHPDLLVIHHHHPLFQITPVLNTGLSLSEPLQLYKGYNAI